MFDESWVGIQADRFIFNRIAALRPFGTQQAVTAYFERLQEQLATEKELQSITFGLLDAIDTKTAALLTHISLMIATAALFYTIGGSSNNQTTVHAFSIINWIIRQVLILEIIIYMSSALLCLRCIRMPLPDTTNINEHKEQIFLEIIKRRNIFTTASDTTNIATFIFIITVFMHFTL
jgi:hypothetical protein